MADLKGTKYLLDCGKDEARMWVLDTIRDHCKKNDIKVQEYIWDVLLMAADKVTHKDEDW